MKKTLIALAALAATGAAFAQSSVTLYGRLDVGYANSVITETQTGKTNEARAIGGANNGLATSYWGIKGSEDLGGGLKANFNLEQDVGVAGGTVGSGFNRISTVGLEGGFGSLNIGRYYTPFYLNQKVGDVNDASGFTTFSLTSYSVVNGAALTTPAVLTAITSPLDGKAPETRGNGIHYATPNFSGFSARVMLAPNDSSTVTQDVQGSTNVTNNGLSAQYANGPLFVGIAWGEQVSKAQLTAVETKGTGQGLAATYDFGVAKLFANWGKVKLQNNTGIDTYFEKTETNVGVAAPFGKTTVSLAWGRNTVARTTNGAEDSNLSGNDWILGATYDLSKRTALYAKTGVTNKYEGNFVGVAADTKTTVTAVGVRHLF